MGKGQSNQTVLALRGSIVLRVKERMVKAPRPCGSTRLSVFSWPNLLVKCKYAPVPNCRRFWACDLQNDRFWALDQAPDFRPLRIPWSQSRPGLLKCETDPAFEPRICTAMSHCTGVLSGPWSALERAWGSWSALEIMLGIWSYTLWIPATPSRPPLSVRLHDWNVPRLCDCRHLCSG